MRITWTHPEVVERVRAVVRDGRPSWEEVFAPGTDRPRVGTRPDGVDVPDETWPRLAEHVARAERVREALARDGVAEAARRFGASPHAIERAALLDAAAALPGDGAALPVRFDLGAIAELLDCPIDEFLAYGQFLSLLVAAGVHADDTATTVAAYERFVDAAGRVNASDPSWIERVRAARDGLADLYVRVRRPEDAERVYQARFAEEPADTSTAIGAARAFLEAGETARCVAWLERAAGRARAFGRVALADQLDEKCSRLRARLGERV